MNVTEIITKYLKENGFDGLCNEYLECGCAIGDLSPCDDYMGECEPAFGKIKDGMLFFTRNKDLSGGKKI